MSNYGQQPAGGYGAPATGPYAGQQPYGAAAGQQQFRPPGPGQQAYGVPPAGQQQPFGAPPGQAAYGGGQPGYTGHPGAPPPQGYGAPAGGGWPGGQAIDPQVRQWFETVDADRSGRITAIELQQALVNANWSHFNPETSRLMIGMFDRDNTGTIELSEFNALWNYINQWKGTFERFDTNRSGQIDANELSSALQQMGYNLSPQFTQMIVCKFDVAGRRNLTLDNFIQSCVMIKNLTDMFRQKDTQMSGRINISYDEFMYMAICNKP